MSFHHNNYNHINNEYFHVFELSEHSPLATWIGFSHSHLISRHEICFHQHLIASTWDSLSPPSRDRTLIHFHHRLTIESSFLPAFHSIHYFLRPGIYFHQHFIAYTSNSLSPVSHRLDLRFTFTNITRLTLDSLSPASHNTFHA